MKRILKTIVFCILGIIGISVVLAYAFVLKKHLDSSFNMALLHKEAPALHTGDFIFRDLNKNGRLDPYEDKRRAVDERVNDLLKQMTIEEKAGAMFINQIGIAKDGSFAEMPTLKDPFSWFLKSNSEYIVRLKMSHFDIYPAASAYNIAKWNNNIQKMAERTRLGIPVTISANPMHGAIYYPGMSPFMNEFSHWPFGLGMAATRDTVLVREFGEIARQEYMALGIRLALSPMADLATEPRWHKISNTFGEDAELSAAMTRAYILGFQGDHLGANSVACMTKHFPGGGPHENGEDSHFPYGKTEVYPGGKFDYHLLPFVKGALPAGTAEIMPYYAIPKGITSQSVGFAFNKEIITGLLREKLRYDGIICTDWNLINQYKLFGIPLDPPKSWGVENLSPIEKVQRLIESGCDQFGGEDTPELIVELVKKGLISESRIDQSVKRILREKFILGLFDDPYVDISKVNKIVGKPEFVQKGELAQRKSIVLLKNDVVNNTPSMPLTRQTRVYVENIDPIVASKYAVVVKKVEDADYVIMRLQTPFDVRKKFVMERFYHQGRLDFTEQQKKHILGIITQKPAIVDVFMDRPAVIPEIADRAKGLLVDFGATDEALFDIIFGKFNPTGKLPFEMPSSMQAVRMQKEDVPMDSKNPLYQYGAGISFPSLLMASRNK
ncbi:MAG: glycoside hydrolase family 3 C-terminal domain-containing protein [Sediminibacterium magnilacihabitans]|jgi:beta-glucosidase|nr:glycoside hydrolase family 3 C-terminal domain-containing protein [Sediminibacterium magnilacihabitans]PQV59466.1 beta-glucosidase [Sediminibacterium magnilacihabitans]